MEPGTAKIPAFTVNKKGDSYLVFAHWMEDFTFFHKPIASFKTKKKAEKEANFWNEHEDKEQVKNDDWNDGKIITNKIDKVQEAYCKGFEDGRNSVLKAFEEIRKDVISHNYNKSFFMGD